mmetsp:Transcript_32507/g.85125  ORF Transcript_32507/g.85125 Transcript_32507/m.85125 type:complete len:579 (+) Transcript_32507:52-1788(+)
MPLRTTRARSWTLRLVLCGYWMAVCGRAQQIAPRKPRILSTNTTIEFHAAEDFAFTFEVTTGAPTTPAPGTGPTASSGSGARVLLSELARRLDGLTGPNGTGTGCPAGSAVNGVGGDGQLACTSVAQGGQVASLRSLVGQIQAALPVPCELSPWSAWMGSASSATESRSRTVVRESRNAIACSEFATLETRSVPEPDFCNGGEIWYNLNSVSEQISVASYAAQDVLFLRRATPSAQGGSPFGRRVTGGPMTPGQVVTVTPASLGLTEFRTGDALCGVGSSGGIEVIGATGAQQRDLVPSRLNGTAFTFPVVRGNPQIVYVHTLGRAATVTMSVGTVGTDQMLFLGAYSAASFTASAAGRAVRLTATAPILASTASGAGSTVGTPSLAGTTDYTPLPPVAGAVFGLPEQGVLVAVRNTSVAVTCVNGSSGPPSTQLDTIPAGRFIFATARSTGFGGPVCVLRGRTARLPIAAFSIGNDAVPWLPASLMRRQFVVPTAVRALTLVCDRAARALVQVRRGVSLGQQVLTIAGNSGVGFVSTNASRFTNPGTFVTLQAPATAACYAIVDGARNGDTMLLWGH